MDHELPVESLGLADLGRIQLQPAVPVLGEVLP
jgi:hypothetical protein